MKIAILDRDGPINVDLGYVHRPEQWKLAGGAVAGMRLLRSAGFCLTVATNQSGVGRGRYALSDVLTLHQYMEDQLRQNGIELDAIVFCPHDPQSECACRKPNTGMAREIESQLGSISYRESWVIGDKLSDVEFGINLGANTGLIRSRYWSQPFDRASVVGDDLLQIAEQIIRQQETS